MNRYSEILEFNKILDLIKNHIILNENIERIDNLVLMNDLDEINKSLEEVDEATILIQRLHRFPLTFTNDINKLLTKCYKNGVLSTDELLQVSKFIETTRLILLYSDDIANLELESPRITNIIEQLDYLKALHSNIKQIINPFGEINDDASPTLKDIRKRIRDLEKGIQSKLKDILSTHSSKLTESIISIRNDRYVIPVKNEYKNSIKGVTHDISASGETVFIEPIAIFEMNNNLNILYEKENDEVYRLLKLISSEIGFEHDILRKNYEITLNLDLIYAKAQYCLTIGAVKPNINKEGIVELYKCFHPLLNVPNIVTNNIIIGKEYQAMIITGPNTGGKTVLLKTIGLLSIMVKAGILIPCDKKSNIMIFDDVYADIGDEQSIEQNLSTFSSHIKSVIDIMDKVSENSLVVLDELGSGTDPVEGSSLAIAIIDYLLEKKCLVITTSHYSELKIYAYNSKHIINASVEFNIQTLMPTYKLLIGVPGQSNALKIASILGLRKEIIDSANQFAKSQSDENNQVLEKLVAQSHLLDQKITMLEEKERELNNQLKVAYEKYEESIIDRNKIIRDAEDEAKEMISKTTKRIDKLINQLDEMHKKEQIKLHEISQVKGEFKALKEKAHIEDVQIPKDIELKPQMSVFVENYQCYGIIIKELKNNKYDVQVGNATIAIDKKYLKPVQKQTTTVAKSSSKPLTVKKNVKMSLDLRGERYEDAKDKLEKYLDDVIYAGLMQVSIIHGFGTGTIRELVKDTIKKYSRDIESSRYGGAGEGGMGVTVITFKK